MKNGAVYFPSFSFVFYLRTIVFGWTFHFNPESLLWENDQYNRIGFSLNNQIRSDYHHQIIIETSLYTTYNELIGCLMDHILVNLMDCMCVCVQEHVFYYNNNNARVSETESYIQMN